MLRIAEVYQGWHIICTIEFITYFITLTIYLPNKYNSIFT